MNTLQELAVLRANLADIVVDLLQDPSTVPVDQAIGLYKALAIIEKDVLAMQGEVKAALNTALTELNAEYIEAASGKVQKIPASERTSWDGKGLDKMCLQNPAILSLIGEHRKVTMVKESLRIT